MALTSDSERCSSFDTSFAFLDLFLKAKSELSHEIDLLHWEYINLGQEGYSTENLEFFSRWGIYSKILVVQPGGDPLHPTLR